MTNQITGPILRPKSSFRDRLKKVRQTVVSLASSSPTVFSSWLIGFTIGWCRLRVNQLHEDHLKDFSPIDVITAADFG